MGGTREVLPGEELNVNTLQKLLFREDIISGNGEIQSIQQFSQGFSNLTYLITTNEGEYVLRKPPVGATRRGHDMSREYKVLKALYPSFKKVPEPLFYGSNPEIGVSFYIMERVNGIILNNKTAKKWVKNNESYSTIADTWLNGMVELHHMDYQEIGLGDLGRPEGYVSRQVANWTKQFHKAATKELPIVGKVISWLDQNQPAEYDHTLIHNDYKYDNVMFEDDSWKELRAILDWEMCTVGDPLMDLGASLSYWTMQSDGPLMMNGIPSPTVHPGNPGREEIVVMYEAKSGKTVKHLVFYYVFGLFKLAVIAQQIYYRYYKGLTKDAKFSALENAAEMLCTVGHLAIQKKRIEQLF